uniref:Fibronectin type-III domain-containing protein n=1 Tax=Mesocestoides corti TaxID=53468 RepID=A0A5K3FPS0_MESCO
MDYQISWEPPLPPSELLNAPGSSHPSASNSFTRYRVMWAPRKDEPVDASMYNDEAGFSPIPDLQNSDVRVVDKNQTSLILPRLRPRTVYILRIQTLGPNSLGRGRESTPAVHYFVTHDDRFRTSGQAAHNGLFIDASPDGGATTRLTCAPCLTLLLLVIWFDHL